jgi:hypothetical protein
MFAGAPYPGGHVKKLVALGAGALAIPAAAALFHAPIASAEPASPASLNVVGEQYGRAVAILKSQGVRGVFGGSVGSDVPQAQCVVESQTVRTNKFVLNLNCTKEAAAEAKQNLPQAPAAAAPGGAAPTPGNGQGTYGHQIGVPIPVG